MHVVMLDGAYKGEVREVRYSAAKELIDAGRAKPYCFDVPAFTPTIVGETEKFSNIQTFRGEDWHHTGIYTDPTSVKTAIKKRKR